MTRAGARSDNAALDGIASQSAPDPSRGISAWSSRRKTVVLAALLFVVAGSLSGWLISSGLSSSSGPATLAPGTPAPGFSLASLTPGRPRVSLRDYRGRPVVINFFASWCPPCRNELPEFAAASRTASGRVQFVGVDVGDTSAGAHQLVSASGVTYPIGVDSDYRVAGATYPLLGMPTTVFVNSNGTVAGAVTGQVGAGRLNSWLRRLEHPI